jgi:hypothetical protein
MSERQHHTDPLIHLSNVRSVCKIERRTDHDVRERWSEPVAPARFVWPAISILLKMEECNRPYSADTIEPIEYWKLKIIVVIGAANDAINRDRALPVSSSQET